VGTPEAIGLQGHIQGQGQLTTCTSLSLSETLVCYRLKFGSSGKLLQTESDFYTFDLEFDLLEF